MSVHLIGDDGELIPQQKLLEFFSSQLVKPNETVKDVGVQYHVVGVFGGQSSGKSTLLNEVFGTHFQTMDEELGRQQTTKGAFLAQYVPNKAPSEAEAEGLTSSGTPPLFIVDFEGTDGMERGEDQSFERQLSLFALSVVDTLIINMWAVDVGRYNAANMALLRTVFEVNLQLFSHDAYRRDEKPTLLVVLRDFTETDLERHANIVRKSLEKIWESIAKPATFASSEISTLFHLRFCGLSHYKLQKEQFASDIVNFRRWFTDPLSPKFVFDSKATFRGIPLESLPQYFANCWEAIQRNKDLDIPSQREMVARHRSTEIFESLTATVAAEGAEHLQRIKKGDLQLNLEAALHAKQSEMLTEFQQQTKLYAKSVVQEFYSKLKKEIENQTQRILEALTQRLATECLRNVDDDVQAVVDDAMKALFSDKDVLQHQDLAVIVTVVRRFWGNINRGVLEIVARIEQGSDVSCFGKFGHVVVEDQVLRERAVEAVSEKLVEKVRSRVGGMATDACATMHKAFEYVLSHNADGTVRFFSTTAGLQAAFPAARLCGLAVIGCLFYSRLKPVAPGTANAILEALKDGSMTLVDVLGETIDEVKFYLQYSTEGESSNPSVKYPDFAPMSSLSRGASMTQRAVAAQQQKESDDEEEEESSPRPLHFDATISCTSIDPQDVLMSKAAVRRAVDLYAQQIQFTMQMQLRTIETSQQNIPMWMWGLVLVLGYNEIYFVITSPALLLFVILIGYFFFSAWIGAQWQRFEEAGPPVLVTIVRSGIAVAKPLVDDAMKKVNAAANSNGASAPKVSEEQKG